MGSVDVRVMKLNKWYIPKTVALNDPIKNPEQHIAIGYFDAVEVRQVEERLLKEHPFIQGYKEMASWKLEEKTRLVDFGSQEQILFTDVCSTEGKGGFSKAVIDAFWAEKGKPYLFVSMVHIYPGKKLKDVLEKIESVFKKDFLSYISFDYCDIVIFDKELYIKEFLRKVKELFPIGTEEKKQYVFDSFSLVSFNSDYVCANAGKAIREKRDPEKDQFSATINLSVRNHDKLQAWYDGIKNEHMEKYDMYGRYDVSIVNECADTKWLLYMMNELHKEENQELFWTFETSIKISEGGTHIVSRDPENEIYQKVAEVLQTEIETLQDAVNSSEITNKSRFLLPIYEVRDCICSIAKNNFAEEFIYCVYESFEKFIKYMAKEILLLNSSKSRSIVSEEKIAKSYDRYFTALNTLVNSTMHGERQFIQATAFNAIFYYVPPKIMAFYNAYVYQVKHILENKRKDAEDYAFLIYPSFSPVVFIERISLEDRPPCGRILTVMIDEQTLYDLVKVCCQLVHEVAHYIGSDTRCREKRWDMIAMTLLELKLSEIGMQNSEVIRILRKYVKEKLAPDTLLEVFQERNQYRDEPQPSTEKAEDTKKLYFSDLPIALVYFMEALKTDPEGKFHDFFKEHYDFESDVCKESTLYKYGIEEGEAQKAYIRQFDQQYKEYRFKEVKEQLGEGEENEFYVQMLILLESVYREAYADVQMILVLELEAEDYLNLFLRKQGISERQLFAAKEDILRVGTVLRVMKDCGFWEGENLGVSDEVLQEVAGHILCDMDRILGVSGQTSGKKGYLDKIRTQVKVYKESLLNGIRFGHVLCEKIITECGDDLDRKELREYEATINGLYEYLLMVVEKSLKEYQRQEKKKQIDKIRKALNVLINFNDAEEIFNCIEQEMGNYRNVLFS